jgi:hypothetical protein
MFMKLVKEKCSVKKVHSGCTNPTYDMLIKRQPISLANAASQQHLRDSLDS